MVIDSTLASGHKLGLLLVALNVLNPARTEQQEERLLRGAVILLLKNPGVETPRCTDVLSARSPRRVDEHIPRERFRGSSTYFLLSVTGK